MHHLVFGVDMPAAIPDKSDTLGLKTDSDTATLASGIGLNIMLATLKKRK